MASSVSSETLVSVPLLLLCEVQSIVHRKLALIVLVSLRRVLSGFVEKRTSSKSFWPMNSQGRVIREKVELQEHTRRTVTFGEHSIEQYGRLIQ